MKAFKYLRSILILIFLYGRKYTGRGWGGVWNEQNLVCVVYEQPLFRGLEKKYKHKLFLTWLATLSLQIAKEIIQWMVGQTSKKIAEKKSRMICWTIF